MKRVIFILSLIILIAGVQAQDKKKNPVKATAADTTITPAAFVQNSDAHTKQIQSQMRSEDWYERLVTYQVQMAYEQGKKDLAKSIKDSTFTIPK